MFPSNAKTGWYPSSVSSTPSYSRPKSTVLSKKNSILGSVLLILWLSWGMAHAQSASSLLEASHGTSEEASDVKFCNLNGYVKDRKSYYRSIAKHCATWTTGLAAVNKDDIAYQKVHISHIKESVSIILDHKTFPAWSLDGKLVTAHIRVYDLQPNAVRNQYQYTVEGIARYDRDRGMYYVRIPKEIIEAYTKDVGPFETYRMKSCSGSPVEYKGKHMGTVSWIMYNPHNRTIAGELEPFEARLYIAPSKPITTI